MARIGHTAGHTAQRGETSNGAAVFQPAGLALIVSAAVLSAAAMPARADTTINQPTRLIVRFNDDTTSDSIHLARAVRAGQVQRLAAIGRVLRTTALGAHIVQVPDGMSAEATTASIAQLPGVRYVQADVVMSQPIEPMAADATSDGRCSGQQANAWRQWGDLIGLSQAYDLVKPEWRYPVVGVVDSGTTYHPYGRELPGYDFVSSDQGEDSTANDTGRDSDFSDRGSPIYDNQGRLSRSSLWHGTAVAGVINGKRDDDCGVSGVANAASVTHLRGIGRSSQGQMSDLMEASLWAAGLPVSGAPANPNPVRVLNWSFAASQACGAYEQDVVNRLVAAGVSIVVAAGNSSSTSASFSPASCRGVIAVAATDVNGKLASYSNNGPWVTIGAPGGDSNNGGIPTEYNLGAIAPGAFGFAKLQGTSLATPYVTGTVALLLAARPSLDPTQVKRLLTDSAQPSVSGDALGSGVLHVASAVQFASAGVSFKAANGPLSFSREEAGRLRITLNRLEPVTNLQMQGAVAWRLENTECVNGATGDCVVSIDYLPTQAGADAASLLISTARGTVAMSLSGQASTAAGPDALSEKNTVSSGSNSSSSNSGGSSPIVNTSNAARADVSSGGGGGGATGGLGLLLLAGAAFGLRRNRVISR